MECFPLHAWKVELFILYLVTIINQLNNQNLMRYYIIMYMYICADRSAHSSCSISHHKGDRYGLPMAV